MTARIRRTFYGTVANDLVTSARVGIGLRDTRIWSKARNSPRVRGTRSRRFLNESATASTRRMLMGQRGLLRLRPRDGYHAISAPLTSQQSSARQVFVPRCTSVSRPVD